MEKRPVGVWGDIFYFIVYISQVKSLFQANTPRIEGFSYLCTKKDTYLWAMCTARIHQIRLLVAAPLYLP